MSGTKKKSKKKIRLMATAQSQRPPIAVHRGSAEDVLRLAVTTLEKILPRLRNDAQGGYNECKDGKFSGGRHSDSLHSLRVTSEELDTLFEVAGIEPDAIVVNGDCDDCVYGSGNPNSRDQGWSQPCSSCARPKMTNFVSLAAVKSSALKLSDDEAQILINARDRAWWATGIVVPRVDPHEGGASSKKRVQQMARCQRVMSALLAREMVIGAYERHITNKGHRALRIWQSSRSPRPATAS